jgi:hypothetical protein
MHPPNSVIQAVLNSLKDIRFISVGKILDKNPSHTQLLNSMLVSA